MPNSTVLRLRARRLLCRHCEHSSIQLVWSCESACSDHRNSVHSWLFSSAEGRNPPTLAVQTGTAAGLLRAEFPPRSGDFGWPGPAFLTHHGTSAIQ